MIHVFVGTKAQLIKMAPIMQEMDHQSIHYNFIDAGQHAQLTPKIIEEFRLREPDVLLRRQTTNINTLVAAITWTVKNLMEIVFRRQRVYQEIFRGKQGICLIHGDTLTTLLSLFYAKRCGIKVAHVEAGLRSNHLFDPFPEEIIRLMAMRYSDVLFAPTKWAAENLQKMGYLQKTVIVGGNTAVDAVRYAVREANGRDRPHKPYVVASTHRVETIYSRSRLTMIVALLERIARDREVLFVVHEPTRRQLSRFGLEELLLKNEGITILPLQPYLVFIDLLIGADFIVADGGSIQEESYFLNVPCLIMRTKTEREEGLGANALLSQFDQSQIDKFLQSFSSFKRTNTEDDLYPSRAIVERVRSWA